MSLTLVAAPAALPVLLSEVKDHLRLDTDQADENKLALAYLRAAVDDAESFLGKALITQTWDLTLDCFPAEILVPRPPLQSVTSVTYIDTAGAEQTLDPAGYQVSAASLPGRIRPAYGATWPATRAQMDAVTVRFVCGYGADWNAVPDAVRAALLLMTGDLYEHRETLVAGLAVKPTGAAERLLWPHRYMVV